MLVFFSVYRDIYIDNLFFYNNSTVVVHLIFTSTAPIPTNCIIIKVIQINQFNDSDATDGVTVRARGLRLEIPICLMGWGGVGGG